MARRIVIEEYHLTVLVPRGLPDAEYDAIHLTLTDANFEKRLLRVVRRVFQQAGSLAKARVRLSR